MIKKYGGILKHLEKAQQLILEVITKPLESTKRPNLDAFDATLAISDEIFRNFLSEMRKNYANPEIFIRS